MSATEDSRLETLSRARVNYALAVLVLVYAVNFIDRNILAVLLQPIKQELGASDTAMGFLTGFAFALFYTFAGIPIARIADRGSRRTVMAVGVAFWSAMTAASGLAQGFWQLALARVGVGVGEASATPAAHSLISDYYPPERRTRAIAIYNVGAGMGVLFGLLLGGWLAETVGWRWAFAAVGLPGLAVALLVRFTLPEPVRGSSEGRADRDDAPGVGETLRYLAALPTFRHLALSAGLYGMTAYGLLGWAPTFVHRVHEVGLAETGRNLGFVIGIAGSLGAFFGGVLCDRLAQRDRRFLLWIPAAAGAALAPCYALFVLTDDYELALLAFVPVNLFNVVFAPPTYMITQGLARLRMRAMASAVVLFVLNLIGLGLGPTLVGVLNDALEPRYGVDAIRASLLLLLAAGTWGVVHSLLAARTLERDLARAESPPTG
jgi:predicted MFS family arabinose efflux permease